ncbi:MAG: DUF1343 domain-containing protein [Acidobacteria bacterium]|jgi:uncharacterized protein YbbC (DUF1343 family)/CubicO group peptidase (beta-lactamase class C family)|nr:MAG: DUF1343 domain-containing protein [Acidobacteriota bacterium]GIU81316.1 MAG: hypothetical protein KatS3mg006_0380 [Pyrinomonadaceae bacterium]
MFFRLLLILLAFFFGEIFAQSLTEVKFAEEVGVSSEKLKRIDEVVQAEITNKKLPGAVVLVGRNGKVVYRKAFGNRALVPKVEGMTVDTIFDVASLTKPVATATSIMILLERGKIRLNDTIGQFIPEIKDERAKRVTIRQLLTHTSGYAPDFDLSKKWTGYDAMLQQLYEEPLRFEPGTRFVYSDIGFIVLGEIVRRVVEKEKLKAGGCKRNCFEEFVRENVFEPLGMKDSQFFYNGEDNPKLNRIAPTESFKGQQSYLGSKFEGDEESGNKILRGVVHDPTASRMGGVAGHAGLFSTADDLARFCQMILDGGKFDGKRILSSATIAKWIQPQVVSESGATRALGWDMNTGYSSNRGDFFPLGSFGHTGFTGTSIWIDPLSKTFVIFLSNRVHPDGKGDVTTLRGKISTIVASAIEDLTLEAIKRAEADYFTAVSAQLESFKSQVNTRTVSQTAGRDSDGKSQSVVLNGIDVLEKEDFRSLEGMRIGLVTNHTGRNLKGKSTIDVLFEAKNLKLVALFSPEHGIRGELDQEKIADTVDEKTGLPIYSLYSETRRPKPEQLKDLDAIVFDIQDIGTRFYTYITTLLYVMEEAGKLGKTVVVLDRPNPINGVDVEGPLADPDKLSFVVPHVLPVRHGMTVGELAQMFKEQRKIPVILKVIKMQGWSRSMWFDETTQTWINPSPNMRSLTEATLYPGIGLLETTNLSVGRGTDTPFEVIGAPWIDAQRLASYLNQRNIPGVRFVPVQFVPKSSVFKGERCNGVNIIITNRQVFRPVRTGIEIAIALRKLFPSDWKIENYNRLLANNFVFEKVRLAESPEEIEKSWQEELEQFKKIRAQFLLYK